MEKARDSGWARFWEARGRSYPHDDPIAMDGWDYGISLMGPSQAANLTDLVVRELALGRDSRLLEVGCGAGMLLGPLSLTVATAVGCDLAESMLKRARHITPGLQIQVAEACHLPYAPCSFDAVLVYSVMHYFPSDAYTRRVLLELVRICDEGGVIWIGDIPDKARREEALEHRARLMKANEPIWPWPDVGPLVQRFYDAPFFLDFAAEVGSEISIHPQQVAGYIQGQYRYNVHLKKR